MSISPGTERAIVNLSQNLPRVEIELEKLNRNLESLEGLASLSSIPDRILSTFQDLKSLFTEIETDGSCVVCHGRGWWFLRDAGSLSLSMCHECQEYPNDEMAAEAAMPALKKLGIVLEASDVFKKGGYQRDSKRPRNNRSA